MKINVWQMSLLLLGLFAHEGVAQRDMPRTRTEDDRSYVALNTFARFYGFPRPRADEGVVELSGARHTLRFQQDSRHARVNGVSVWLHEPVRVARRAWLISETDVRTVFDPVLRPARHVSEAGYGVIMLDAGHGGRDTGGRGGMGTLEKDMTLTITGMVADNLRKAGYRVLLTRDEDRYLSLAERVDAAREAQADLFVSIHFNTSGNTAARGAETFVLTAGGHPSTSDQGGGSYPPAVPANSFDGRNMLLGYLIQRNLLEATGNEDRGLRRSRFFVLREAVCPAVLVECAFLTNPQEERNVHRKEYQARLARGIAQGVLDYLGTVLRAQLEDAI